MSMPAAPVIRSAGGRTGAAPKYGLLAEAMRQRIYRGEWPSGHCIPSLLALAEAFGVARLTAREAVQVLVQEGLLESLQGKGTFVTGQARALKNIRMESTLADLSSMYVRSPPEIQTLDERTVTLSVLPGSAERPYVQLRRVHADAGTPYCIILVHIDADIFALAPERFRTEAAIPVLVSLCRRKLVRAGQTLTVGTLDAEAAHHLQVAAGSPAAYVRRVIEAKNGQVAYFADVTYRGDLVRLEIELKV